MNTLMLTIFEITIYTYHAQQSYSVNIALALHMKERTLSKVMQAFSNLCDCGRVLDQESGYGSLACKVSSCTTIFNFPFYAK